MDILKLFGKNVKKYRIKINMTQEKLAEHLGIEPDAVCRIETGKHFITAKTFNLLIEVLHVSPEKLFDFGEPDSVLKRRKILKQELLHNLSLLNDDGFNYFADMLKVFVETKNKN